MTEKEQFERLAVGFIKLDNDRKNFLDDYTRQLVKTCCSKKKTAIPHGSGNRKIADK
jgi:hypothetical protein